MNNNEPSRLDRLEAIVESNARAIQALANEWKEDREQWKQDREQWKQDRKGIYQLLGRWTKD
jgi:hypothetical protein